MKIRIQEIELGSKDPGNSKVFYHSILGFDTIIDQEQLKVFRSGIPGLDFNISTHLPAKIMVISFLTDNLQTVMERLNTHSVSFEGPKKSHLGMMFIEFTDPDGYLIKINQPTPESPSWLTV